MSMSKKIQIALLIMIINETFYKQFDVESNYGRMI